jgi:hypothetical protein
LSEVRRALPVAPSNLSRRLLRIKDDGAALTVSSGIPGSSDELKAGIWAMAPTRVDGYPGAPNRYLVLAEVIDTGSPQQTRPTRLAGKTLLTLAYDPAIADPNVGPTRLWTAAGVGENGENVPDTLFFRRDGAGYVTLNHRGNNGDGTRTVSGKYSTAYDAQTGWTEFGTPPLVNVGAPGAIDDYGVSDTNAAWLPDGSILAYVRLASSATNASIGLVTARWDGNVNSPPTFTKYASNPVMQAGAGGSWSDTGIAPGGVLIDPSGRFHMWPGARIAINSFGYAYSDDGRNWTAASTVAWTISNNPEQSAGDQTSPMDDGDVAFVGFGGGWNGGDTEGRFGTVIPYEKPAAAIRYPGRFPYPTVGSEPSQALTLSAGGIQATNLGILVGRFRKYEQTRATDLGTIFCQIVASLSETQKAHVRVDASGMLEALWVTASGTITLTSSAVVDDALWHKFALVLGGANSLELWVEREGVWALEASSASTLGTVSGAVIAALGNRPAGYTAYGSHPLRGTYCDVVFATGTAVPSTTSAKVAAFEGLLSNQRVVWSDGTIAWDSERVGGHTGDIPLVEAAESLELPCVTTDGSSSSSDHEASAISFVGLDNARIGILRVVADSVGTNGVVLAQLAGRPFRALPAARSGSALVQFFYLLDADLPSVAGFYSWLVRVDGSAGQVSADFSWIPGRVQRPPVIVQASGTGTSLSATVAATAGGRILDALYSASAADATPHPTQTKQSSYRPNGTAPRLLTSHRRASVAGSFDLSWSGLTNGQQHLMVATHLEALTATPTQRVTHQAQVAAAAALGQVA